MINRRSSLAVWFLCLLPGIALWRCVLFGNCVGPFDQMRQMAPWHGATPTQPWDVLQADGVLQFFPWRDLVFSSWAHFQPPFWNPYELAGTPLLANSQSGGFYPLHILVGLLHIPTPIGIVILAWIHLAAAGLGVFALSRRLGGSLLCATIGGASFLLSPFMLAWTALPSVVSTVCWIPWSIFFLYQIFSPTGDMRSVRATLGLGVSTAMMVLAGHLQFVAYGLMAIFLVAVVLTLPKLSRTAPRVSRLALVLIGLVIGLLAATPQLLPVLAFSKTSNRLNKPSPEGYSAYISQAIQPFELATLANPIALGNPRESVDEKSPGISAYWPKVVKSGANFAESAICIGPLVLGLLACVSWRRKEILPIVLIGAIFFLLATGTPLDRLLYFYAPGWSATGSPGRACVLFVLAASILAGSVNHLSVSSDRKKVIPIAGCLATGIIFSFIGPILSPTPAQRALQLLGALQATASFSSLVGMALSLIAAILGLFLILGQKAKRIRFLAALVPLLIWVSVGGEDWVTSGPPLPTVSGPPAQERVAYLNTSWDIFQAAPANTPPDISSANRIHEIGGYDSLLNGDTVNLLNEINGGDSAPPVNGNMMFIKKANLDALSQAGVSFIGDGGSLSPIPGALGRLSFTGGSAVIRSEDLSSLTIDASGSGTLILRDRNMPGWTAQVDGRPAELAPGLWRKIQVLGNGSHRIVFRYVPPGFDAGIKCLILALLVAIGLAATEKIGKPKSAVPNV